MAQPQNFNDTTPATPSGAQNKPVHFQADAPISGSATPRNVSGYVVTHDIPAGGATGQVLEKNSGTDYDVGWATPGGGGGGGFDAYTAPPLTGWTHEGATTTPLDVTQGYLHFDMAVSQALNGIYRALPAGGIGGSTPFAATAVFRDWLPGGGLGGLFLSYPAQNDYIFFFTPNATAGKIDVYLQRYSAGFSSFQTTLFGPITLPDKFLKTLSIEYDGTTVFFYFGDGSPYYLGTLLFSCTPAALGGYGTFIDNIGVLNGGAATFATMLDVISYTCV